MPKRRARGGRRPHGEPPASAPLPAPASVAESVVTESVVTVPTVAPVAAAPIVPSPALAEAMGAVLKESERRIAVETVPPPRAAVPSGWLAAALGTWLIVAWLLLAPPALARGPEDHPWRPTVAEREASLRYGLWLAHDRVEGFRREHGRLPSFLAEAGVEDGTLTLVVEGERDYTLEGRDGPMELHLGSAMAADSFLGSSLTLLDGAGEATSRQ